MANKMQIQPSRGLNETDVAAVEDLKPWKNTWFVHVKVLHSWKQIIQSVETMEFVFADDSVSIRFSIRIWFMFYLTFSSCILMFPFHMSRLRDTKCRYMVYFLFYILFMYTNISISYSMFKVHKIHNMVYV